MLLGLLMDALLVEVTRAVYPSRDYICMQGIAGGGVLRPHPWARGREEGLTWSQTLKGRWCQGTGRLRMNREDIHAKCKVTWLPIIKLVDYEEGHVEYAASGNKMNTRYSVV